MSSRQEGRGPAVVTSTSIGVGAATALHLADHRFRVVASDRRGADGATSAESLTMAESQLPT